MNARNYILTHSGVQAGYHDENGTPSIDDITLGLSRMPRFAGQGRVFYSVLDHSLFAASLVQTEAPAAFAAQLAVLLHDAHEAMTQDCPTPFKTVALREMQKAMDRKISAMVCLNHCDCLLSDHDALIKMYDLRALRAEALVIGPPSLMTPDDVTLHFGGAPEQGDVDNLRQYVSTMQDLTETKRRVFAALVEVLRTSRDDAGNRPGEG
jgi:hypothetical protein